MRFVLLIAMAFNFLSVFAQDNVIDEIVWVVGDEPILRSEVESQRLNAQYEGVKFSGDPYCVIPEQLAVQKLFLHQADLDSIIVSESDVINGVDRKINYFLTQLGSQEKLEEYFRMPLSRFREAQRESEKNQETVRRVKDNIIGNIAVTPSDVRQYYKELPPDSIPMIPAETEVEIITID
ncbi:MAG: hypothetical protein K8E24_012975, partial [Methanobacterium paludis]|nr:hypothetical protein [Methanobacterium paludis]